MFSLKQQQEQKRKKISKRKCITEASLTTLKFSAVVIDGIVKIH